MPGIFDDDYQGEGYEAFRSECAEASGYSIDRTYELRRTQFSAYIRERENLNAIFKSIESEIEHVSSPQQRTLLQKCLREGRHFIEMTNERMDVDNSGLYLNLQGSNYCTQFMQDTGSYLNALISQEPKSSLSKKQGIFLASANTLSKDIAPSGCSRFLGALQAFAGAIIALATLFCVRSVARNGYRMFMGSESRAVDSFKQSILESWSTLKHGLPKLGKS